MTSPRRISTQWVQHIKSQEEKDELLKELQGYSTHIEVLTTILKLKLDSLEKERLANTNYDSPSWAYKQADYVGSIRELRKILELITPMTEGN